MEKRVSQASLVPQEIRVLEGNKAKQVNLALLDHLATKVLAVLLGLQVHQVKRENLVAQDC